MEKSAFFGFRSAMFGVALLVTSLTFQAAPPPDGKVLYARRCVMCHGPEGKGFPAIKSPDLTDPKWQASVKDKDIFTVIKDGKKDTAMKAFGDKLGDEEIQALVAHIRSLNSEKKKKD